MTDVTDSWHTFAEAEGAEYLSSYVTIWYCPASQIVVGESGGEIEWVMEREAAAAEE